MQSPFFVSMRRGRGSTRATKCSTAWSGRGPTPSAGRQSMSLSPGLQAYEARGQIFANVIAERRGTTLQGEIFIIGAHYDTHKHSPGANDNASGMAALMELARHFASRGAARTLRFVAFTNEESP